jgi:hypothetical protein
MPSQTHRLPYLHIEESHHGKRVYYVRQGKGPRIRIPDGLTRDEWMKAYREALAGVSGYTAKVTPIRKNPQFAFIYVISDRIGLVKVGYSIKPRDRLASFETANGRNLTLAKTYRVPWDQARGFERTAHKSLAKVRENREWFYCDVAEACAAIEAALVGTVINIDFPEINL